MKFLSCMSFTTIVFFAGSIVLFVLGFITRSETNSLCLFVGMGIAFAAMGVLGLVENISEYRNNEKPAPH